MRLYPISLGTSVLALESSQNTVEQYCLVPSNIESTITFGDSGIVSPGTKASLGGNFSAESFASR